MFAPQGSPANSGLTMNTIVNGLGNAVGQQESQLLASLSQLQANPNGISETQMLNFQAQLQVWESVVTTYSSIIKVYGDTTKQVATNTGS